MRRRKLTRAVGCPHTDLPGGARWFSGEGDIDEVAVTDGEWVGRGEEIRKNRMGWGAHRHPGAPNPYKVVWSARERYCLRVDHDVRLFA